MLNGDIGEGSSCIMDVNAAGEIAHRDRNTLSGMVRGESTAWSSLMTWRRVIFRLWGRPRLLGAQRE